MLSLFSFLLDPQIHCPASEFRFPHLSQETDAAVMTAVNINLQLAAC